MIARQFKWAYTLLVHVLRRTILLMGTGYVSPTIAVQLLPHYGRLYLLYDTTVWTANLRPTGTAKASNKRLLCEVHAQPHGLASVPFFLELVAPEQSLAGGHLHRGGTDCAHTIQPYGLLQTAGRATAGSRDHDRVLDISPAARPGSFRARAISLHSG